LGVTKNLCHSPTESLNCLLLHLDLDLDLALAPDLVFGGKSRSQIKIKIKIKTRGFWNTIGSARDANLLEGSLCQ